MCPFQYNGHPKLLGGGTGTVIAPSIVVGDGSPHKTRKFSRVRSDDEWCRSIDDSLAGKPG
jgi:hypothetical protein